MAVSSRRSPSSSVLSSARSRSSSACSVSACEWTDTYSPAAIDMAPATRPAIPATNTLLGVAWAAATPSTRLAVDTMPSFAPSTAARSQPMRSVRCRSRWRLAKPVILLRRSASAGAKRTRAGRPISGVIVELEHGDAGKIDPMIFRFGGRARGAEIPLLAHDVTKRLPAIRRPAQHVFLRPLGVGFQEVQANPAQPLRRVEEQANALRAGLCCAPAGAFARQQGGLDGMCGILGGDFHLRQISPRSASPVREQVRYVVVRNHSLAHDEASAQGEGLVFLRVAHRRCS